MSDNNNKKPEANNQEVKEKESENPQKIEENSIDEKQISIEDKLKDTEDKLLRSLAELENQRRRFDKEIKDAFEFGSFNFARESLAILDNLQRAKDAIRNDKDLKINKDLEKFIENITIIEKDITTIFEKNKIKKIETKGKKFDPNLHQAMTEIEDEKSDAGIILQEIQAGYMFGERLLRPALVGVSKKKNKKIEENGQKKEG